MLRVLFVDEDEKLRNRINRALESAGIEVKAVDTAAAAQTIIKSEHLDFALLDLIIGDETGTSLAPVLTKAGIPFAYLSEYTEDEAVQRFGEQVRHRVMDKGQNGGLRMDLLTRIFDNIAHGAPV